jgi:4-hydroxy-tetrahydrodipicolinate reductase
MNHIIYIHDSLMTETMTIALKIAIAGASGRMGVALIKALSAHPTLELTAAGIRLGSESLARSHFESAGVSFAAEMMTDSTAQLFARADAVIDFTSPENTVGLAGLAALHKKILISGTTGLNSAQKEALIRAGESARVVWSANMSVGVNLLMALVEHTSAKLPEADIEILEMHHRHKVDAPSGTALALGEAAARGRDVSLGDVAVRTRDGHTGARKEGSIGFATLRGGDVIGDHTVMFASSGERLELSHKASSRDIYARGALVAAEWVSAKPNGFYTMRDVVKL